MGMGSLPGTSLVRSREWPGSGPPSLKTATPVCPPSLWLCCLDKSLNFLEPQLAHLRIAQIATVVLPPRAMGGNA